VTRITAICLLLATGCATIPRNPVPAASTATAQVPGYEGLKIRMQLSFTDPDWRRKISEFTRGQAPGGGPDKVVTMLMISGGGENGAYGAGVLCGWSESGERPEFDVVTGISTGGLIGPLAFLGRDYDAILRNGYTEVKAENIFDRLGFFTILHRHTSLTDTKPLARMIAAMMGEKELQAIAREHRRGRRLYIGTTDLDSQTMVVWDIGAIAASERPDALALVHRIMLASAAIPVVFPPVLFPVEVDGKRYEELHVDGGTMAQVFGGVFLLGPEDQTQPVVPERMFLMRNGRLEPMYAPPEMRLLSLADRSASTSSMVQGYNDVLRAFMTARKAGAEFYLTSIPASFTEKEKEPFDRHYMRALFAVGYEFGRRNGPWLHAPPGLEQEQGAPNTTKVQ
jgi:predicted acylesterase/phospholipase RssA